MHLNWEVCERLPSAKTHLKRVIGNAILTYEKLYTILIRIEAVLNSRSLSSDLDDLIPPPGHFLVDDSLSAPLELDQDVPMNRLTRSFKGAFIIFEDIGRASTHQIRTQYYDGYQER